MANQTAVTTTQVHSPLFFSKVSSGPEDSQLLFKLIYFWKTRNNSKGGILPGLEMLMIDEEKRGDIITGYSLRNMNGWTSDLFGYVVESDVGFNSRSMNLEIIISRGRIRKSHIPSKWNIQKYVHTGHRLTSHL
ncbi:hypothetical protein YC2023_115946 [Brassica napus]